MYDTNTAYDTFAAYDTRYQLYTGISMYKHQTIDDTNKNRIDTREQYHKGDTVGRKTEWEQRYDRPKNLRSSKELAVRSPVRACPHQNTGIVAWRNHAVWYRVADTIRIRNCIMLVIPFYKDRIVLVIPF